MGRWRLVPHDRQAPVPLEAGRPLVVGRGTMCDIRLADETVSRQHAELRAGPAEVQVRDLGSANGTRVNGAPVTTASLTTGDEIAFGRLRFRLERAVTPPAERLEAPPGGAAVRAVDVRSGGGALARLQAERLAGLVGLATRLGHELRPERVIDAVLDLAAELLPADRVAMLLLDDDGASLRLAATRARDGAEAEVPRSIAWRAIEERSPVVTDDAGADARLRSGSVVRQQVRAALCVPLLAGEESVLGALYLDARSGRGTFADDEAALAFAFGGLAAVALARARWAEAARREAVARTNLERFFAPAVAARIAGRVSAPRPGGERLPVTVLFNDVRGFTRLAESLAPEAVAAHLSEYFEAMVEVVFAHGGTLDKFVGDALLAVWGAPEPAPDDAARALAAALAMRRSLVRLNARWHADARPELGAGIGLHAGEAFAGTIGSARRLEYTVIGDVVNLASRLCDAARPGEIRVSEVLLPAVPPGARATPADPLVLAGRAPVGTWLIEEET